MARIGRLRRVDIQVSIMTAVMVTVSCLCLYFYHYHVTYHNMIRELAQRVDSIYLYVEDDLDKDTFTLLRTPEDMDSALYQDNHRLMSNVRVIAGVRYLYTATRDESGQFIYLLDGLALHDDGTPQDPADFRRPGDPIEEEIVPELNRAMAGEAVLPTEIKDTGWGKVFVSYLPVHDGERVVGVVGVEFEAQEQYYTYRNLRWLTPSIIVVACILSMTLALVFFRRISNPSYRDLANTDQLTQLKSRNAFTFDLHNWEASRDKRPLGVLLADLNNLKRVNDSLGHERGDEYIRLAARAMTATGRKGVAYRVGGDEFAYLLPDADESALAQLAADIQGAFAQMRPDWPVDTALAVGWAVYDRRRDSDLQATFRRADEAMYQSKRNFHGERRKNP